LSDAVLNVQSLYKNKKWKDINKVFEETFGFTVLLFCPCFLLSNLFELFVLHFQVAFHNFHPHSSSKELFIRLLGKVASWKCDDLS